VYLLLTISLPSDFFTIVKIDLQHDSSSNNDNDGGRLIAQRSFPLC
jgi:hypothetical protein